MKIGITERGDASLDLSWAPKIMSRSVDAGIIITKNLTDDVISSLIMCYKQQCKIIVHCTCTGWGFTRMEPFVPTYETQLDNLRKLINKGFPADWCVLRIDPIFPTDKGIAAMNKVIQYAFALGLLPMMRVRVSIFDEYAHVKERFKSLNWPCIYDTNQPNKDQINKVLDAVAWHSRVKFEACAEPIMEGMSTIDNLQFIGCISEKDLQILGLSIESNVGGYQRAGCKCLTAKTELLSNKARCKYNCVYCYWH